MTTETLAFLNELLDLGGELAYTLVVFVIVAEFAVFIVRVIRGD